jgi:hypothetical protein
MPIAMLGQCVRLGQQQRVHAPHQLDHVLHDQEDGIGDQHQHHLVLAVHPLQQATLDQGTDQAADKDGRKQQHGEAARSRQPATEPCAGKRAGRIGAQRIEAAVGHVEDAHDAIDQRQPGRDQEQPGRIGDAVEGNGQDAAHWKRSGGSPQSCRP